MQLERFLNSMTAEKKVTLLGFGVTGRAVATFLEKRSVSFEVIDDHAQNLSESMSPLFCGYVSSPSSDSIGVIASPGVAPSHPALQEAKNKNLPIIGELELAAHFLKGKFIGVTGTNGKSTTVTLIYELLKNSGIQCGLYGNIGDPLISATEAPECDWYVIEESSYQLEQIEKMRHHIAICLNVTDDHFDRYKNIDEYAAAKERIISHSQPDDYFIYNDDDFSCHRMAARSNARNLPYSLAHAVEYGGFTQHDKLIIRLPFGNFTFDSSRASLKGLHNLENMLAALSAALIVRHDEQSIASYKKTLENFHGLSHRMEKVHSENGVDFYDDSKATNVGAVVMALATFPDNVILIAGGRDKMGDYKPLKGLVSHKVKTLILLGEAREKISQELKGLCKIHLVNDMKEAVKLAKKNAQSGDVVLLSPACSSFDQYKNYKERGDDFKKWALAPLEEA